MTKQRWLKVTISYREGDRVDQWDAVVLGETSITVPAPVIFHPLAEEIEDAATELVRRSERLSPPEPLASPEAVAS